MDNPYLLSFDADPDTIESRLVTAFQYNVSEKTWSVEEDTDLFSVEFKDLETLTSFDLNSKDSITDPNQEIPEPLTILGSATALGFVASFKRKLKSSKSTVKETINL